MSEEIIMCACGFKTVKAGLYKTHGRCPCCQKMKSRTIHNECVESDKEAI